MVEIQLLPVLSITLTIAIVGCAGRALWMIRRHTASATRGARRWYLGCAAAEVAACLIWITRADLSMVALTVVGVAVVGVAAQMAGRDAARLARAELAETQRLAREYDLPLPSTVDYPEIAGPDRGV